MEQRYIMKLCNANKKDKQSILKGKFVVFFVIFIFFSLQRVVLEQKEKPCDSQSVGVFQINISAGKNMFVDQQVPRNRAFDYKQKRKLYRQRTNQRIWEFFLRALRFYLKPNQVNRKKETFFCFHWIEWLICIHAVFSKIYKSYMPNHKVVIKLSYKNNRPVK